MFRFTLGSWNLAAVPLGAMDWELRASTLWRGSRVVLGTG